MLLYSPIGKDTVLLDVTPSDDSVCQKVLCESSTLTLRYALTEYVELPVGTWCEFDGERYTLENPAGFKMEHSRLFDYTLTMHSPQKRLERFILYNTNRKDVTTGELDRRTSFFLTDKPVAHLSHIVKTMNARDKSSVKWVIDDEKKYNRFVEKTIQYDHITCAEALKNIAAAFELEWEVYLRFNTQKEVWERAIGLNKIEYNVDKPLALSYGRGNGIKSGVTRRNFEEKLPLGRLYVKGGERNIDPSKNNKSKTLLLPVQHQGIVFFDGERFPNEAGYNGSKAVKYRISEDRCSVALFDLPSIYGEQTLDCTEIYPQRIGKVSKVVAVDASDGAKVYDIIDDSIPDGDNFNYSKCILNEEKIYIVFQDGMLAGREFGVSHYYYNEKVGTETYNKRFALVSQTIDGVRMPNEENGFMPKVGDKYIVFGITLPDGYISDNISRTGASWDMLRKALKYFHESAKPKFTFKGELDRLWVARNRGLAKEKIRVGGIISFTDPNFQKEPILIRITSVKQNINNLDNIQIELSNEPWKRDKYVRFNSKGELVTTGKTIDSTYQFQTTAARLNTELKDELDRVVKSFNVQLGRQPK